MLKFCVQMGDGQVYNIFENHPDRPEDVTGIIFSVQGGRFRPTFLIFGELPRYRNPHR